VGFEGGLKTSTAWRFETAGPRRRSMASRSP
jgi:hypothetical protein